MSKTKDTKVEQEQRLADARMIEMSLLEVNRGQLYGLPKNPRFIKDERYQALVKSIQDAPEMLNLRELLVYPLENGHYIIIGGNMRYRACEELGFESVPCKVLPVETPVAKLREYTIKDNEAFGNNDWDILANEWSVDELKDWGVDVSFLGSDDNTDINNLFEDVENQEEKEKTSKITISVPETWDDQLKEITEAVKEAVAAYEGVEVK